MWQEVVVFDFGVRLVGDRKECQMRKKLLFLFGSISIVLFVFAIGYMISVIAVLDEMKTNQNENYPDSISGDGRYKMQVAVEELEGSKYAQIVVRDNLSDDEIFIVEETYRTFDLKWLTWESNTNNFWVKSSDVGTFCYVYCDNEKWEKCNLKRKDGSYFLINGITDEQELVKLEDLQERLPQECYMELLDGTY